MSEPITPQPSPWWDDEDAECSLCGKRKPDTKRRITLTTKPLVCNRCFEQPGEKS